MFVLASSGSNEHIYSRAASDFLSFYLSPALISQPSFYPKTNSYRFYILSPAVFKTLQGCAMFFCFSLSLQNRQSTLTMFVSASSGSKSAYISPRCSGAFFSSFLSLRDFDISTSCPKTPPPKPCSFLGLCVQNTPFLVRWGSSVFLSVVKTTFESTYVCADFFS